MDTNHPITDALLPVDAEARVVKEARKEGIFAGLTGGLGAAVLGARLYGFGRNKTIICGILTGAISGYLFTQAFTSTALAQLRAEETRQYKVGVQVSEFEAPASSANSI